MHSILKHQIKKFLKLNSIDKLDSEWKDLLQAISETYTHFDEDRAMIERSLEISSQELNETNEKLQEEVDTAKERSADLKKLNDLMIGRELKMIELKKELQKLRKQHSNK